MALDARFAPDSEPRSGHGRAYQMCHLRTRGVLQTVVLCYAYVLRFIALQRTLNPGAIAAVNTDKYYGKKQIICLTSRRARPSARFLPRPRPVDDFSRSHSGRRRWLVDASQLRVQRWC